MCDVCVDFHDLLLSCKCECRVLREFECISCLLCIHGSARFPFLRFLTYCRTYTRARSERFRAPRERELLRGRRRRPKARNAIAPNLSFGRTKRRLITLTLTLRPLDRSMPRQKRRNTSRETLFGTHFV